VRRDFGTCKVVVNELILNEVIIRIYLFLARAFVRVFNENKEEYCFDWKTAFFMEKQVTYFVTFSLFTGKLTLEIASGTNTPNISSP